MTTKITLNNIADTALATLTGPKVTTIVYPGTETATDIAGGATINLTGGGFQSGCSVLVASTASSVVTFISSTQISFIAPALAAGTYVIYVINPDGGTAISIPGVSYSGTPNWTTTAGTLGDAYETGAISATLTATGDAPIIYTLASGTLPTGSTLASNGTLSGTAVATASATTYTFTVTAKDAQNQTTNRSFSLTINPDVVTWSTPTASATYTVDKDSVMANVIMSATSAAGGSITYTADTLPTGLSITGANIAGTPTVTANTSTTLTATSTATRSATRIINWVVNVAGDTYFPYTTLLLSGNGTNNATNNTFLDGSTNNFAITRNGNTTQGTFSPYGSNWSTFIPSAGGTYITAGSSTSLALGAGNFTIECWLYLNSLGTYTTIFDWRTNGDALLGIPVFSDYNNNGTLTFAVGAQPSFTLVVTSSSTMPINSWFHLALVRSGSTVTMYFNGTSVGSGTSSANIGIQTFNIGNPQAANYGAPMYVSNVRLVKGTAVYTSNFTPSTTPLTAIANTQLLTCQSNRLVDNSTNAFSVGKISTISVQRFSPFSPTQAYSAGTIGGSGYFDGTGDYLTLSMTGGVGSGDFTIEYWFYPTALYNYITVFATTRSATGLNVGTQAAGQIVLYSSGGGEILRGATAMKLNTWNHCAYTRSGTTMRGYLNGIQDATGTSSNNFSEASAYIGQLGDGGELPTGYVSDLRVVSGTALYTGSTLTVPTAPLTAVSNTRLLTNFTNAGIIDNTMINNLETVGNAQISTAQTKFGSGSMYFDGSGDYLLPQSGPQYAFGTGNFTVECWIYATAANDSPIYESRTTGLGSTGFTLTALSSSVIRVYTGSSSLIASSGTTYLNTWTHVAVVRSGATTSLYINGTSVGTSAGMGNLTDQSTLIGAGRYSGVSTPNAFFTGYIDDLRITKGFARYTSNFTAPTTAFITK
jgi:hypothetical protein